MTLQPAQGDTEKPCGVDFILRCYVAKNAEDKIEKRNSVRLAIKKITHAPAEHTKRVSHSSVLPPAYMFFKADPFDLN